MNAESDTAHIASDLTTLLHAGGLAPLQLGGRTLLPIVQGGMGVGVSAHRLAGSVAALGAVGTISAAAHLCTERFVAMIECGLAGKIEDGRAHAEALLPVIRAAYTDPNPAIFKGVLHAEGRIPTPDVRLPLTNGSVDGIRRCLDAVARASHP